MKLTGLQAGATRVIVNVTIPGVVANKPNVHTLMYSAFIDIEIVDQFILTKPNRVPGSSLLMAPFSHVQLETNMDQVNEVIYT